MQRSDSFPPQWRCCILTYEPQNSSKSTFQNMRLVDSLNVCKLLLYEFGKNYHGNHSIVHITGDEHDIPLICKTAQNKAPHG